MEMRRNEEMYALLEIVREGIFFRGGGGVMFIRSDRNRCALVSITCVSRVKLSVLSASVSLFAVRTLLLW